MAFNDLDSLRECGNHDSYHDDPIKLSKGEIFSPSLCIFEKQYYRYMGEFFLTCGWYTAGVLMAMVFLVVPGIVLGIIWSQALYLVLDGGESGQSVIIE